MIILPNRFNEIVSDPTTAALSWRGYKTVGRGAILVSYHDFLKTLEQAVLLDFLVDALTPRLSVEFLAIEEIEQLLSLVNFSGALNPLFLDDLRTSIEEYDPLSQLVATAVSERQSFLALWESNPECVPPKAECFLEAHEMPLQAEGLKLFLPVLA